ncbi:urease accessory protein UreF [Photobacterium sp. SDRW27]|uniref:urease accessory protein UreF n=1 Tax=Photobacterium obscurum TaxID=2829490 RepID=UPI0022431473|nr:urease accessory protein UreF [Photobacterium obscurum]MCW8330184.1 urease accessory protein UreF [Photobacterium obscurum]
MLADFRLYQLMSPSLPIGAFTYSQGLEWAVERGWVTDQASLQNWLADVLYHSLVTLELPILQRQYQAIGMQDVVALTHWNKWLYANRETKELRLEERQRGKATARLLKQLDDQFSPAMIRNVEANQLAGFALAANYWDIEDEALCAGYLWSWLENATMAGVKLIPLGQTAGQQILLSLSEQLPVALAASKAVKDHEIGSFTPAQVLASSRHESQYTRLYRS